MSPNSDDKNHYKILIVGGGTAGITVAARLSIAGFSGDLAIVEPSADHYYQPFWTLVGAGAFKLEESRRDTERYIPRGARWIKDAVTSISGEARRVKLQSGREITCDWMIVATGVELHWDGIKGARDAMSDPDVTSIYDKRYTEKTYSALSRFKSGKLIFTFPQPPVKCAGAPQKIMYLADEILRRNGVRDRAEIEYRSALAGIFGIPVFADVLNRVIKRKNIHAFFNQKLIEIRASDKVAVFADMASGAVVAEQTYDFLHVVPPMRPHDFIRDSDLCLKEGASLGWVDVDQHTLRHKRWPHVFSLGDVCSAPNAKTGAAIRKQAPVVVANLLAAMEERDLNSSYDGYASCPLVTGFGKVVLAEFGYDSKLMPSFPMNPAQESRLMWWLKTLVLPRLYWYFMLRGRA